MPLKKLSINEYQVEQLMELLSKNVPTPRIAKVLCISHVTLWRNMDMLGLGVKRNRNTAKKCKKVKYFRWEDINNSLI